MSASLVQLPRLTPLNGGTTVAGAQLFIYEAGTTTKRNTYTTSALSVANANPVVADANGRFGPIWISQTAGNYKLVLAPASDTDPPASPFWTEDNIIPAAAYSSAVATLVEGSFTGTLTGYASNPTGTINYLVISNAAGVGKQCTLRAPLQISGTSNATTMTMTGLPAACQPSQDVWVPCNVKDAGSLVAGAAFIDNASPGTVEFFTDPVLAADGFTGSGTKGIDNGWQITYLL